MLETILVSGAVALVLCVICLAAWNAASRRILAEKEQARAEEERAKLVPDAIVGRDYRRLLHDIRGPLQTIRMAAGLLTLRGDSELDEVSASVTDCAKLIDGLVESINSMDLAQDMVIVDSIRNCAKLYGNGAEISIDVDREMELFCIPMVLDRMIGNIISNAAKHRARYSEVIIKGLDDGRGFSVVNKTSNRVDTESLWGIDKRKSGLGMGIIKSMAAELGVTVTAECTKAYKGWLFRMEVKW